MIHETYKHKTEQTKSLFLPKNSLFFRNKNSANKSEIRSESIKLNKKIKCSYNENKNKKMNKTQKEFSQDAIRFPLLSTKTKINKINDINEVEQRINNYKRMRKYRVKLVKVPQPKKKIDNVYKLFRENGLQFLFPQENKNFVKNNVNNQDYNTYRKKKSQKKRLRMSLSTKDMGSIKYKLLSPTSNSNNLKIYQKRDSEEDEDIYKPSFKKYMKLQSLADMKFRPVLGETSSDLINFLKKIEIIRKEVINNYIDEINGIENRYNIERPKEDFKFKSKIQGLYQHKWKNIFSLRDYQELFCENLKGKISSKNYDIMEKNFRDIFLMCFSTGGYKNNNNNI